MLLWPDPRIPDAGFIDPRDDDAILRDARHRLDRFAFVGLCERLDDGHLAAWLGQPLRAMRTNETAGAELGQAARLADALTPTALDALAHCSRLDLRLWCHVAHRANCRSRTRTDCAATPCCSPRPDMPILARADSSAGSMVGAVGFEPTTR